MCYKNNFITYCFFFHQCTGMTGCKKTCASDDLDCYVLDNNGFIIISEQSHHTGQFFGQTDGTIMDSLVQDGIYKKIKILDNQGACHNGIEPGTDSASAIRVIIIIK